MNAHNVGLHLVQCTVKYGPIWAFACFAPESHIGELIRAIHGSQNKGLQVVNNLRSIQLLRVMTQLTKTPEVTDVIKKKRLANTIDVIDCILVSPAPCPQNNGMLNILHAANIPTENCEILMCQKVQMGRLTVTTNTAPKYQKRNNSVISFIDTSGIYKYGEVVAFLNVQNEGTFAIVSRISVKQTWPMMFKAPTSLCLNKDGLRHMRRVEKRDDGLNVIRVGNIKELVVMIGVGAESELIVHLPNNFEHD